MRKNLPAFLTIFCALLLIADLRAQTFTPKPDSPLAKGVHPRLFVTAEGIAAMRTRINIHYKTDFKNFVSDLDNLYNTPAGSGVLAEWNVVFGVARSFALLYQVDPSSLSGVTAQHTKKDYGQKALELGLYLAQKLPDSWSEAHHGAKILTSDDGGLGSLALQVVYDWTHDLSTLEQRRAMADRLIRMWNNRYNSEKIKLENHYAANVHVYAAALCFYGDNDLGASYTALAKQMMNSFQDVFVVRQLGVAAKLFEGSSVWVEGDSYAMDGYTGILLLAAAAGSAVGENFFASNPWIHDAPYYIYYNMTPMPYKGEYYFSQQNTSTVMDSMSRLTSAVMNMMAAMLVTADPNLAAFAAWYCEKSPYGVEVNNYNYYDPHIHDFFYKFVFGTKQVPKKSPDEAGIPLSFRLGQMHVMRSDHGYNDATLIHFFSQQYWYQNGHNEEESGAFNLYRFGPLVISAVNTKNAVDGVPRADQGKGMAQNNVLGLGPDYELALERGNISDEADTPADFALGANTHIGTVEAREYRQGLYDYVNYNYTRSYKGGSKASLARVGLLARVGQPRIRGDHGSRRVQSGKIFRHSHAGGYRSGGRGVECSRQRALDEQRENRQSGQPPRPRARADVFDLAAAAKCDVAQIRRAGLRMGLGGRLAGELQRRFRGDCELFAQRPHAANPLTGKSVFDRHANRRREYDGQSSAGRSNFWRGVHRCLAREGALGYF